MAFTRTSAPLIWSIANYLDKYLLSPASNSGGGSGGLIILSSFMSLVVAVVVYVCIGSKIFLADHQQVFILILSEVFEALYIYFYFLALEIESASTPRQQVAARRPPRPHQMCGTDGSQLGPAGQVRRDTCSTDSTGHPEQSSPGRRARVARRQHALVARPSLCSVAVAATVSQAAAPGVTQAPSRRVAAASLSRKGTPTFTALS